MARNNVSLSVDNLPGGKFKVRWREDLIENGERVRKARSQVVSDKASRDALVAKIRRSLESGETYAPEARVVTTSANLETAALAWLRWQKATRGRTESTVGQYKSAIRRVMAGIRAVRKMDETDVIRVDVLSVDLVTGLLDLWKAEDAAAKGRAGAACPKMRYQRAAHLYSLWAYAASQPTTYPGVPAVPARALVVPPYPRDVAAGDAPTWSELDAIVRRAYAVSADYGDALLGERATGLRADQIVSIRRGAVDVREATLTVETGKSAAEKAERRKIPVPRWLLDAWQARIGRCEGPDALLFPGERAEKLAISDHGKVMDLWRDAIAAGEVRPHVVKPDGKRKNRPNHAFRAGYMAGLQAITVEIDGAEVQRISDRAIDFLVGHHSQDTRSKNYTPPTWKALVTAASLVPAPVLEEATGDNVVSLDARR